MTTSCALSANQVRRRWWPVGVVEARAGLSGRDGNAVALPHPLLGLLDFLNAGAHAWPVDSLPVFGARMAEAFRRT
jgi:hypothetical protein